MTTIDFRSMAPVDNGPDRRLKFKLCRFARSYVTIDFRAIWRS